MLKLIARRTEAMCNFAQTRAASGNRFQNEQSLGVGRIRLVDGRWQSYSRPLIFIFLSMQSVRFPTAKILSQVPREKHRAV